MSDRHALQQASVSPCPMVMARGLTKSFGAMEVLKGVDFDVPAGSVTCIIGPSGSGKSTVLRCINHLERPTGGTVLVDGRYVGYDLRNGRLHPVSERVLNLRRAGIGMVFQSFNLFSHMTVLENLIEAPLSVYGVPRADALTAAMQLLDRVGLSQKASACPRQLSGGQQQRVAIARALAMKPKVLLFDEPTSALDPQLSQDILGIIRDMAAGGVAALVVTHDIEFARKVADQVIFLEDGRVVEHGGPADLLDHPQTPQLRQFLAGTGS